MQNESTQWKKRFRHCAIMSCLLFSTTTATPKYSSSLSSPRELSFSGGGIGEYSDMVSLSALYTSPASLISPALLEAEVFWKESGTRSTRGILAHYPVPSLLPSISPHQSLGFGYSQIDTSGSTWTLAYGIPLNLSPWKWLRSSQNSQKPLLQLGFQISQHPPLADTSKNSPRFLYVSSYMALPANWNFGSKLIVPPDWYSNTLTVSHANYAPYYQIGVHRSLINENLWSTSSVRPSLDFYYDAITYRSYLPAHVISWKFSLHSLQRVYFIQSTRVHPSLSSFSMGGGMGIHTQWLHHDIGIQYGLSGLANESKKQGITHSLSFKVSYLQYLDRKPPKVSIQERTGSFSPMGTQNNSFATFHISVREERYVEHWALVFTTVDQVSSHHPKVYRSISGRGSTPTVLNWDGRHNNGHLLPPGVYAYQLRVTDGGNNRSVTPWQYIEVTQ